MRRQDFDVVVIGAGPAGTAAALRAADLGAKTALVTRGAFGGMSANEGPIPVRTLAHAARLAREARQLPRYGISVGTPSLDYDRLIARAREVVDEARGHSTLLQQVLAAGVALFEKSGTAGFDDAHTITSEQGPLLRGNSVVVCSGGISRAIDVPGAELAVTPANAFGLRELPESLLVVGAGATGMQVASIFNDLGSKIVLCQAGPRIAPTEDTEISTELVRAYREHGIEVHENCGRIERFEVFDGRVRTVFRDREPIETQLVVSCIGWVADTERLNLRAAGVRTSSRGFIEVDDYRRTSASHIFAAGDVIGRSMLVPQAVRDGYVAGGNAATGKLFPVPAGLEPIGSFTDPEYAKVGLTEEQACTEFPDVLTARATFQETTRPVIDGRTGGFCKLVIDRATEEILGCHIVGERAIEVVQMAAIAMSARMKVGDVAGILISFPTYANVFGRAALRGVRLLREQQRISHEGA